MPAAPCGKEEFSRWSVPRDTVISLKVYYKKPRLKFADMKIDLSKFEKETTDHLPGVVYYTNRDEGMSIEVIGSEAQQITYFYTAKDKYLLCSDAAPNNSFNRSGISMSFIENLDAIRRYFPPG